MRQPAAIAVLAVAALAAPAAADAPIGGIKGTVIFEGEAPDRAPVDRKADPVCAKTAQLSDDIVVTKGKLAGVLVRVTTGTPPPPPTVPKAALAPVVLEQKDCTYSPRVFTLEPSQGIVVRNADETFHNVHGTLRGKELFNKPQPKQSPELSLPEPSGTTPGDVIEIACDVHPWMHAWGVVSDNRFHAVTGTDGSFEIDGLDPGTYTLEAWHPILGTRKLDVVIGRGNKAIAIARLSFKRP